MPSTPTPGTNCLHNKRPGGQHLGSGPSSFHSRDLEPLTRTFLACFFVYQVVLWGGPEEVRGKTRQLHYCPLMDSSLDCGWRWRGARDTVSSSST